MNREVIADFLHAAYSLRIHHSGRPRARAVRIDPISTVNFGERFRHLTAAGILYTNEQDSDHVGCLGRSLRLVPLEANDQLAYRAA